MPQEFTEYLRQVKPYIKWKKAWDMVETELTDFLCTAYEKSIDKGFSEEVSIQRALEQIGTPETIGPTMNEAFRPNWSWPLIVLLGSFIILDIWVSVIQGIPLKYIIGNVGFCILLFVAGLKTDCGFVEKHCQLIYCILMLLQAAILLIGDRAAWLAPCMYLVVPIVFAGVIRCYAFHGTKGIAICFGYLLLPFVLYLYSGDWNRMLSLHITCIAMLCYAREKAYFRTEKSVLLQEILLYSGMLMGFLPMLFHFRGMTGSTSGLRMNFTLLVFILLYFSFIYFSIVYFKAAGNGMGKLVMIGVTSLIVCTLLLSIVKQDTAPLLQDMPFISHGRPGIMYYFLCGIQIGVIRDGAVVIDSSHWFPD